MYSKQGALIQQFYEALEPRAADAMFALLGQCQHDLEHRGTLSILKTQEAGASGAVLTVANYPIPPDNYTTTYPSNGLAADFLGKVRFRGPVEFQQPVMGDGVFQPLMGVLWMGAIADIPTGWALMDGTANSVGNGGSGIDMRGLIPYGYSGAGDFATIGASIALTFTGAEINGNAGTTALSIVAESSHTHTIATGELTTKVATPVLAHSASSGPTTIPTQVDIWSVDDSPILAVFNGSTGEDSNYLSGDSGEVTSAGHDHDIEKNDIIDAIANHAAAAVTCSSALNSSAGSSHTHTGTVSNDAISTGLILDPPTTLRTPGVVVAFIEKLAV